MFDSIVSWVTGGPISIVLGLLGSAGLLFAYRFYRKLEEQAVWRELKRKMSGSGDITLTLSRDMKKTEESVAEYKEFRKKELALIKEQENKPRIIITEAKTKQTFIVKVENIPDGELVFIDKYRVGEIRNGQVRILVQTGGIRVLSVPNYVSKEINILEE